MVRFLFVILAVCTGTYTQAQYQYPGKIILRVVTGQQVSLPHATVELLRGNDSALIKSAITDTSGIITFENIPAGNYLCRVSMINYITQYSTIVQVQAEENHTAVTPVVLQPASSLLKEVTVSARKPFIQQLPDKIIVNVDAGITNAGTTALEVLEKSPGVSVDRNGTISLKGRQGVLIMIDGKPAYLGGSDLVNLLSGMSSSQLEQIEIMDNPSAKYDAAGNAGIINIKTKKNKQHGFNGNLGIAYGQGIYPKNNNSLLLNYRTGAFNFFLTYSMNANKGFTDLYALRTYYKEDGKTIDSKLEQPFFNKGTGYVHNIRTGMDYFVNQKTTLGLTLTGLLLNRKNEGGSTAQWINTNGTIDSVINTSSTGSADWKNVGTNFNLRHAISKSQELTADLDFLTYRISSDQYFENELTGAGGYEEALRGDLPSRIHILSAKADYSQQFSSSLKLETGWKSSHVNTDNIAAYYLREDNTWKEDLGKTNHFKYAESIHAVYANLEKQAGRFTFQGGLRYEVTGYNAHQLGNAARKDSSFSRRYNSLFPTAFISYKADSLNSFTVSAGRRIDRPAFQKLNPFVFVINKYTYQQGNPFFRPQYTWNIELSHLFKELLSASINYSITKDYISQIFLTDSVAGTIIYTEGNMGRMENFGLSVSAQAAPFHWWSFSAQATLNHKKISGVIWNTYAASITQLNVSINNQLRFIKGWSAELSGFYITRNQNDIQEVLDPTGQVSAGIAKQVLQNKGTVKFTVRDIFYTQAMLGWTYFQQSKEYFKLTRDTRVATLAFTYRFGKPLKSSPRRSNGGAGDEIQRVGSGG